MIHCCIWDEEARIEQRIPNVPGRIEIARLRSSLNEKRWPHSSEFVLKREWCANERYFFNVIPHALSTLDGCCHSSCLWTTSQSTQGMHRRTRKTRNHCQDPESLFDHFHILKVVNYKHNISFKKTNLHFKLPGPSLQWCTTCGEGGTIARFKGHVVNSQPFSGSRGTKLPSGQTFRSSGHPSSAFTIRNRVMRKSAIMILAFTIDI